MTHYEYSIWTESPGGEKRYFWIVDEVHENGNEEAVDSGIENTMKEALKKIRKYCADAEIEP
jgi:hypothetical protein